MNICMVSYSFYETDNRVRRYAEALAERGDRVDAIALRRQGQPRFEVLRGVNVYRIQDRIIDEKQPLSYLIKLLEFFLRSALAITARSLSSRYHVIHVHSVPDFEVFAAVIPKLLGSKIILDIHDIVPEFYASKFHVSEGSWSFRLLRWLERMSCAFADHVIIANDLWYTTLTQRSVRPGRCTALINYPDHSIFYPRARTGVTVHDFVMCYPGTLNRHQGVDIAVRAVGALRNKVPNLKFLILGKGSEWGRLKDLVAAESLEDRVSMLELVPLERVAEIMSTVDLGVVPKRRDSFGNQAFSTKIMEFMSMGVPTVVANTNIDQYYFDDQVVQFFESGNVDDLAAKILMLVEDSGRRALLRQNGLDFAGRNSWSLKKDIYLNLVDGLTAVSRSSRGAGPHRERGKQQPLPPASTSEPPITGSSSLAEDVLATHYRCDGDLATFRTLGDLSGFAGYFRFDQHMVCYGRCAEVSPKEEMNHSLPVVHDRVDDEQSVVRVPFDLAEVVDNLRFEHYVKSEDPDRRPVNRVVRKAYYMARPFMPFAARKQIQRTYFNLRLTSRFPSWPVDRTVENILERLLLTSMKAKRLTKMAFIWFWPHGAPSATIVTHDVETSVGRDFCPNLMDLNDRFDIKASFQLIPEKRYKVSSSLLEGIRARGFEVNVHDLNHDGHLFEEYEQFLRRAARINQYGVEFGAKGFRSAIMYRNLDWYGALRFSYDMSVPNVAHLDPQKGGCCTVFPYAVGDMIELPLTTIQDYSLFHILGDYSTRLWKEQAALILEKHGLLSFCVHPDYVIDPAAQAVYAKLLAFLSDLRLGGQTWIALPNEVAQWWRLRSKMRLIREGGSFRIEGEGRERARIAFAVLDKGQLSYELY